MPIQYGNNERTNQSSEGLSNANAALIQDLSTSFGLTIAKSASIIAEYQDKCHGIQITFRTDSNLFSRLKEVCSRFLHLPQAESLFSFHLFKEMIAYDIDDIDLLLEFLTWVEDELGIEQSVIPPLFIHLIARA